MRDRSKTILVVGAGFAGAVVARHLAEAGYRVDVIDRRPHVAGNAFDEMTTEGIRLHRYGPHLFHTSSERVVHWLSRFTDWVPYDHRVTARLPSGEMAPLPVNRRTLEIVFRRPVADAEAARDLLASLAVRDGDENRSAEDYLHANIGRELTQLFFAPYTRKMWGHELAEVDAAVVRRIPIRFDDEDRYFPNDSFQGLPVGGYTRLIETVLDHGSIRTHVGRAFDKAMLADYGFAFLCSPIDEHYDFAHGPLPYRSIRFHHRVMARSAVSAGTATVNYTDESPFTRSTYWHMLPGHDAARAGSVIETTEEPCDYKDNDFERYYPVKTSDGRFEARYKQYQAMAAREPNLMFIGRCGTYQYLDMHQVVNQTLTLAERWLSQRT